MLVFHSMRRTTQYRNIVQLSCVPYILHISIASEYIVVICVHTKLHHYEFNIYTSISIISYAKQYFTHIKFGNVVRAVLN